MSQPRVFPRPLPRALIWGGSALITFHLFAILMLVLAAQSGPWPWPTRFGGTMDAGPEFAVKVNNVLTPWYLEPLRMTHNYHFLTNRLTTPEMSFEARLKDANGQETTLRFPDPAANAWMRHRQRLLALGLEEDQPVQAPQSEVIYAPGQAERMITLWSEGNPETLQEVTENKVPKKPGVLQPSPWTLLLARSYARYLCREHGAVSVQLTRHMQEPILPAVLLFKETPPETFVKRVSIFREYRRED